VVTRIAGSIAPLYANAAPNEAAPAADIDVLAADRTFHLALVTLYGPTV